MPATVYRRIAQQARKLTGAEITLVAVAINHDLATSELADLMIVETACAAMISAPTHAIPLAGTSIGQAFVERTPRRLNNFDVTIDGVQLAARHWSFRCAPPMPSPGCWSRCGVTARGCSVTSNST